MRTQYIGRVARSSAIGTHRVPRIARAPRISLRWLSAMGKKLNCWFFGGATPYSSGRREFPEVEFHQVLTGKKDHFDPRR